MSKADLGAASAYVSPTSHLQVQGGAALFISFSPDLSYTGVQAPEIWAGFQHSSPCFDMCVHKPPGVHMHIHMCLTGIYKMKLRVLLAQRSLCGVGPFMGRVY